MTKASKYLKKLLFSIVKKITAGRKLAGILVQKFKLPNWLNTLRIGDVFYFSTLYDGCIVCFSGEMDHIPEVAFYMVGAIEEVVAKAERLAEEQAT
jgi:F0F1-type ATP synthase beta subunit